MPKTESPVSSTSHGPSRSRDRQQGLRRRKRHPGLPSWGPFALFTVVLLLVLEGIDRAELVRPIVYAGPTRTGRALVEMTASGELLRHLAASLEIFALGYGLAIAIGIPVGVALGASRLLESMLGPYVAAVYASPKVAFLPLLIMIFGFGVPARTFLVSIICVFVIIINTWAGVRNVDALLIRTGQSLCLSRMQIFQKIVLPHSLPFIMVGLRLGAAVALIGVFVAEMWGANAGLGHMILTAGVNFNAPAVYVGIFIFTALGAAFVEGIRHLEIRLTPWRPRPDV